MARRPREGVRPLTLRRRWQDIEANRFVIEYVGEIIDMAECQRRLRADERAGRTDFYMISLTPEMVIDARHMANMARFINHSCEPNCETQKWYVNREPRIGIVARRRIAAGEELSFDYQLQSFGPAKKVRAPAAHTATGGASRARA